VIVPEVERKQAELQIIDRDQKNMLGQALAAEELKDQVKRTIAQQNG